MSKLANVIKKADLYGHQIDHTFRGSNRHNTLLGGCVSIIFLISIVALIVLQVLWMGSHVNTVYD